VWLTMGRLRRRIRHRSFNAIVREVIEFSRLALGNLETCENIHSLTVDIPATRLPSAIPMPKPIIYPAIAANIGRLAKPRRIVAFFTRIAEIESLAILVAARGTSNVPPNDLIQIAS